jgi:hypothetical protein
MSISLRDSVQRHLQKTLALMRSGKSEKALEILIKAEDAAVKAKEEDLFFFMSRP